jgi:TonB family protein
LFVKEQPLFLYSLLLIFKNFQPLKNRKNKFLHLPQIAGGKVALQKYIETNLVYPDEARNKRIEGVVYLAAEIDDNGKVIHIEIIKGLACGCNEEAIRLIKNVQFGAVRNKGLRLKTKKQFRIKFQLPPEKIVNYNFVSKNGEKPEPGILKNYSYTIQIK